MFNGNVYVIMSELEEKSCAKLPIIIASRFVYLYLCICVFVYLLDEKSCAKLPILIASR